MEQIQASEKCNVQFALICYRDHPPEDPSYVTKVFKFTQSISTAKGYVATMTASGGGDTPEAVADAIHQVLDLPFRQNSTKICVCVSDAPPHGLTKHISDGFPNGWDKHDPIVDAYQMKARQIIYYSVGCEPVLGDSPFARDFFKAIARITGGRYISLANSKILPQVIIGGAEEEMALETLKEEIEKETKNVRRESEQKGKKLNDQEVFEEVNTRIQSKGLQSVKLMLDSVGDDQSVTAMSEKIAACNSLKQVKEMLDKEPVPVVEQLQEDVSGYSDMYENQSTRIENSVISKEQVYRLGYRNGYY